MCCYKLVSVRNIVTSLYIFYTYVSLFWWLLHADWTAIVSVCFLCVTVCHFWRINVQMTAQLSHNIIQTTAPWRVQRATCWPWRVQHCCDWAFRPESHTLWRRIHTSSWGVQSPPCTWSQRRRSFAAARPTRADCSSCSTRLIIAITTAASTAHLLSFDLSVGWSEKKPGVLKWGIGPLLPGIIGARSCHDVLMHVSSHLVMGFRVQTSAYPWLVQCLDHHDCVVCILITHRPTT